MTAAAPRPGEAVTPGQASSCEHNWVTHYGPGRLCVPVCVLCGGIDWDELTRAIAAQQPQAAPDSRRALLDIIDTVDHLDEPGPEADHIRLLAEYGLGEIAAQQPHVCEPMTVQPSDDVKPAPGVILDRLRAAVANHEAPLHRQWYVDEHIIDCDPAEFWAVLAAALKQPQPASSTLRADLEATVKTWLEESTPYPDESAEDTARRGGFGWCASELSQLLAQHPEPQPAPELAAAEHRAELEAAVRELVGQHCRTVGPCRFCDGNTAGIMQLADTYAGLPS